jgi:hypothetical protein
VAGGLLLVSGIPPLTFGGDAKSPLRVAGQKVTGNLVEVTLLNPGANTITGKVVILVATDGGTTREIVPVTVWGGQKVSVVWSAPNPTDKIIRFWIIVDDGAPI